MKKGMALSLEVIISIILLLCVGIMLIIYFQGHIYETVHLVEMGGATDVTSRAESIIGSRA
ncbi:hypothetical protein ACFLQI_01430 [Candidatus Undinarchaeota archaeon]